MTKEERASRAGNRRGPPLGWTEPEIREAFAQTGGNIAASARWLMAKHRRKCGTSTIHNALVRSPDLAAFREKCREVFVDFTEAHLMRRVQMGDMTAIKYVLSTQAKGRGYSERTELVGPGGAPLVDLSGVRSRLEAMIEQQAAALEARGDAEDGGA